MKVLAAVDGSEESLRAVGEIGSLLQGDRDDVLLYTRAPEIGPDDAKSTQRIAHDRDLLAKAILDEASKRLPQAIIPKHIIGTNDPRRGIILAAEQSSADLIVVGARGLGMLQRIVLGSVSSAIVHASRIPVWVARKRPAAQTGLHVLVACHSPEAASAPARLLSHFSWPEAAQFTVLTTTASFYGEPVPEWLQQQARSPDVEDLVKRWTREREEEARALRARFEKTVGTLQAPMNKARTIVVEGNPAEKILATIEAEHVDLVVVGSYTHRPLMSALLGSTAEAVLNHAPCSVLVLPHQESP